MQVGQRGQDRVGAVKTFSRADAYGAHASSFDRFDPGSRVFDAQAIGCVDANHACGVDKDVRGRFPVDHAPAIGDAIKERDESEMFEDGMAILLVDATAVLIPRWRISYKSSRPPGTTSAGVMERIHC